jgi:magnesium chelatase family protein
MALARINALTLHGLHTHHICLEVTISRGLPAFSIVGLPDTIVKESRERIRSAIRESGFDFPIQRITINLAPANLRKEGPGFELPMAIGILVASGQVRPAGLTEAIIMGELGLNGSVRPITGMLPIAHAVARTMHTPLLVAPQNAREAVAVGDVCAYAVDTLRAAVTLLEQPTLGTPATHTPLPTTAPASQLDWSDVKGQAHAKRGLEIAAAGGHHVMMIGTPGSGKSMLAHRLSTIVPPLTRDESLEVSCIHSVAGVLPPDTPLLQTRVVRAPHHTASAVALIGGTAQLRPGEISLAHRGVLFLDELPGSLAPTTGRGVRSHRPCTRVGDLSRSLSVTRGNESVSLWVLGGSWGSIQLSMHPRTDPAISCEDLGAIVGSYRSAYRCANAVACHTHLCGCRGILCGGACACHTVSGITRCTLYRWRHA